MDHTIRPTSTAVDKCLPAQHQADVAPIPGVRNLNAGKAVTLRAKQLSVLRIAHGRVWATLSDVGPYSRAMVGDHFLSQGQSLTLLPGQELVMESLESSASSHSATAHFSWETPGAAASTLQDARPALQASGRGVLQPLRDLRHALSLVAGACGRLVQGLAHGAVIAPSMILNSIAIYFVALRGGIACPQSPFDREKRSAATQAASCSTP